MATMQSSTLRVGKPAQLAARHGIIEMSSMCSAESRMVTATLRGGNQRGGTVNEETRSNQRRKESRHGQKGEDTVKAEVETRSEEGARYLASRRDLLVATRHRRLQRRLIQAL